MVDLHQNSRENRAQSVRQSTECAREHASAYEQPPLIGRPFLINRTNVCGTQSGEDFISRTLPILYQPIIQVRLD
jgi:hypothetical protein